MATFSPHHFEGKWTHAFEEGEKQLEGMEADTSKVEVEEVEAAKLKTITLEVLDMTKLYHYNERGCRMTVAVSA